MKKILLLLIILELVVFGVLFLDRETYIANTDNPAVSKCLEDNRDTLNLIGCGEVVAERWKVQNKYSNISYYAVAIIPVVTIGFIFINRIFKKH